MRPTRNGDIFLKKTLTKKEYDYMMSGRKMMDREERRIDRARRFEDWISDKAGQIVATVWLLMALVFMLTMFVAAR